VVTSAEQVVTSVEQVVTSSVVGRAGVRVG
jgi:hypothetical protein